MGRRVTFIVSNRATGNHELTTQTPLAAYELVSRLTAAGVEVKLETVIAEV